MTENEAIEELEHSVVSYEVQNKNNITCDLTQNVLDMAIQALEEIQQYRAIGTIEEIKDLKEKNNKDFELLLKSVKESYPMFKGAYVELDVFIGDVMRRFTRERK